MSAIALQLAKLSKEQHKAELHLACMLLLLAK